MGRRLFSALGLILAVCRAAAGQDPGQPDVADLARRMAQQVRHLGEDNALALRQSATGRQVLQDSQELAQTIDEFRAGLAGGDAFRLRQAFTGIDGSWQDLRGRIAQPAVGTPDLAADAGHVEEVAVQLRRALGLNEPPPGFYGNGPAPSGVADTRRLASALVSRADALAAAIRAEMANAPDAAPLAQDATLLAREADRYHDALDPSRPIADAGQSFAPVDTVADRLERYFEVNAAPARVKAAWQAVASVEALLHRNLGLTSPQPAVPVEAAPPAGGGPSPVAALAEQLAEQTGAFVQVFGPTAGVVPEGGFFLADAQRLLAAASGFRDDAARGLDPGRLAFEFRDVDACWQRLARRTNRIARGRTGPNIQQVAKLGVICGQIHQALGMPGYPPELALP